MFRIFTDTHTENESADELYYFGKLAINSSHVVYLQHAPCTEVDGTEAPETWVHLTSGDKFLIPKPIEEVCKILCGAKL